MSDWLKYPKPAGLPVIELISPPKAVEAFPMALKRAVPPLSPWENKSTSFVYCAWAVPAAPIKNAVPKSNFLIVIC
ncbi:hypothetical protein D3C76_1350830 [compost metagenome]